jgi:hypothetical protein
MYTDMYDFKKAKRSKFKNKRCLCLSKHSHASKFEASYCNLLLARKHRGEILSYTVQESFNLNVNNLFICAHIVDFIVMNKDNMAEVHETKGVETDVWKLKYKLFRALYPSITYLVVTKKNRYWPMKKEPYGKFKK